MIKKSYSTTGKSCRVTFRLPAEELGAETVSVLGDFNGWSAEAHPLKLRKNGSFSATISLKGGESYRFRYLVDGRSWSNDEQADDLAPNRFGSLDGVLGM